MQPYIFASLGSNYTLQQAGNALWWYFFPPDKTTAQQALTKALLEHFPEHTVGPYYLYKGRDALSFALTQLGIGAGTVVLTQAFTCHAIEAAIRRTGAVPGYVDLAEGSIHPSVETLAAAYKQHPAARAVLVQHTLGCPADTRAIALWCRKNGLRYIEDLAQAYGGCDETGAMLGSGADAVILSFGRDKILDGVTGGACMLHKDSGVAAIENFRTLTTKQFFTDALYPLLTWIVRKTYPVLVGRILLYVAKRARWITSPVRARFECNTSLSVAQAAFVLQQFATLRDQLQHRKTIAALYAAKLGALLAVPPAELQRGSCLRVPLRVAEPDMVARKLQHEHIYIADRWYRTAVDSGSLHYATKYRSGSCPRAEELAAVVLTLPTHRGISEAAAERIAESIKAVVTN